MKILFVCKGNVGRSQMAGEIFKMLNQKHEILIAGTNVVSKEGESRHGQILKDLLAAENVISVFKDRGIDISQNIRTQLSADIVEWADKVVVMVEVETIPDYLQQSPKMIYWKIVDPKGNALEARKIILNQIEGLVGNFIAENNLQ